MWACNDCNIRFYPACPICIDVGHRSENHVDDQEWAAALEVRIQTLKDEIKSLRSIDGGWDNGYRTGYNDARAEI